MNNKKILSKHSKNYAAFLKIDEKLKRPGRAQVHHPEALDAMNEVKEILLTFTEWVVQNQFNYHVSKKLWTNPKYHVNDWKPKTTEELYEIFIGL